MEWKMIRYNATSSPGDEVGYNGNSVNYIYAWDLWFFTDVVMLLLAFFFFFICNFTKNASFQQVFFQTLYYCKSITWFLHIQRES